MRRDVVWYRAVRGVKEMVRRCGIPQGRFLSKDETFSERAGRAVDEEMEERKKGGRAEVLG